MISRTTATFFLGWLLLAGLAPLAADSLAVRVELAGEMPTEGEAPGEGLEIPISVEVELPRGKKTVESLRAPGTARFEVAVGTAVQVAVSTPGWWAPRRALYLDGPEEVLLRLWPTGFLSGELRVPEDSAPPTELAVRFRPAPGNPVSLEEGSLDCPLDALRFRCEIPAGVLDLRLRARGFVSHYRWGVEAPAHEEHPLGVLTLRAGASVVGWIEPPGGEFRFSEVQARLEPVTLGSVSGRDDLERRDVLSQTARPNQRGFFELSGVAPGSYVLSVEHPGYATTTLSPVTVLDGAETEVRQITLSPPAALEVRLDPPRHPLSHWIVELHHLSRVPGHSDRVAEGPASAEGVWTAAGLESGEYRLRVLDRRGSSWADQEIEVAPEMEPIRIELPMVRLEGMLTLGGEPLTASLYFGGRHAAKSIVIRSNEEGKFYVFLPREPDTWIVDVVHEALHLSTRVRGVEVRRRPGERPASWSSSLHHPTAHRLFDIENIYVLLYTFVSDASKATSSSDSRRSAMRKSYLVATLVIAVVLLVIGTFTAPNSSAASTTKEMPAPADKAGQSIFIDGDGATTPNCTWTCSDGRTGSAEVLSGEACRNACAAACEEPCILV
jgi:hypothetical protein